jgi:hypothetical protein
MKLSNSCTTADGLDAVVRRAEQLQVGMRLSLAGRAAVGSSVPSGRFAAGRQRARPPNHLRAECIAS